MPVFEAVQKADKTLIAHLAEPDGAWMPLDSSNPEIRYYSNTRNGTCTGARCSPQGSHSGRARPGPRTSSKLRVVGCHLGSDEEHWDRLAKRLDSYPNFAVDAASRVRYFASGDHDKAREFLMKYQDRVLYATDFTLQPGDDSGAARQFQETHERDWKFFATKDTLTFGKRQVQGLGLPERVVTKIFRENAIRWLPGILGA